MPRKGIPEPSVDGKVNKDSARSESSGQSVSLDVLCRRAERLIDSVRVTSEQVDRMCTRPDRAVEAAHEAARSLMDLRQQIDTKIAEAQAAEQSCGRRIDELKDTLPTIQQSGEALIQRVMRARELTAMFGQMMESSADKIASLQSAADEAGKARGAIDHAIQELSRIQKAADNWSGSLTALTGKHSELIAAGNATASRLRTLNDAGERLRESVRQDIVALRELLRESRQERIAWEQLLGPASAGSTPASKRARTGAGDSTDPPASPSVPAALADRVKRLTDFIRQATGGTTATADTPRRPASCLNGSPEQHPDEVGANVG